MLGVPLNQAMDSYSWTFDPTGPFVGLGFPHHFRRRYPGSASVRSCSSRSQAASRCGRPRQRPWLARPRDSPNRLRSTLRRTRRRTERPRPSGTFAEAVRVSVTTDPGVQAALARVRIASWPMPSRLGCSPTPSSTSHFDSRRAAGSP